MVFYSKSKRDTNSPKLLQIFDLLPFKDEILFFCVDPDKVTKKRNDDLLNILEIEEVPTIIINNEMMVGETAFKWAKRYLRDMMDEQYGHSDHEEEPLQEQQQDYMKQQEYIQQNQQYIQQNQQQPRQQEPQQARLSGFDDAADGGFVLGSDLAPVCESVPSTAMRPQPTKMKHASADLEQRLKEYQMNRDPDNEELDGPAVETSEKRRRRRFK